MSGWPTRTADGKEAVKALSGAEVREIADRFKPLNPYDSRLVPGSILEMEDRHVAPSGIVRIGKESNRLSETPMPAELDEEGERRRPTATSQPRSVEEERQSTLPSWVD